MIAATDTGTTPNEAVDFEEELEDVDEEEELEDVDEDGLVELARMTRDEVTRELEKARGWVTFKSLLESCFFTKNPYMRSWYEELLEEVKSLQLEINGLHSTTEDPLREALESLGDLCEIREGPMGLEVRLRGSPTTDTAATICTTSVPLDDNAPTNTIDNHDAATTVDTANFAGPHPVDKSTATPYSPAPPTNLPFHVLTAIFPLIDGKAFQALKDDIQQHGLREPIRVYKGEIIDGRNRYRACCELGVTPVTREWDGAGSLVAFVASLNLHRRNLNVSQKRSTPSVRSSRKSSRSGGCRRRMHMPARQLTLGQRCPRVEPVTKPLNLSTFRHGSFRQRAKYWSMASPPLSKPFRMAR